MISIMKCSLKKFFNAGCLGVLVCGLAACRRDGADVSSPQLNIQGKIEVSPVLAAQTKKSDSIFLIARPAEGGPPVAVKRFSGKNYPYEFQITNQDLMIQGEVMDSPLNITARVDRDGNASTKKSGDMEGAYAKNPVSIRQDNVSVVVDRILP